MPNSFFQSIHLSYYKLLLKPLGDGHLIDMQVQIQLTLLFRFSSNAFIFTL